MSNLSRTSVSVETMSDASAASLSEDDLIARLKSPGGLQEILTSLAPAGFPEVMARCALVHAFDESMFDAHLRGAIISVTFASVIGDRYVETVPRAKGRYRLRESERRRHLEQWHTAVKGADAATVHDPAAAARAREFRELNEALATHFHTGSPDELERLFHLSAFDHDETTRELNRLFDQARDRFDLARCHQLLAVLEEHAPVQRPELGELCGRRRAELSAWTLWTDDYLGTARCYVRDTMKELRDTINGDGPWMAQLYASGGMGKTVALRWLVARPCLEQGIPCARIDFDDLNASEASARPWTFLLRFARQLRLQFYGAPFDEFLKHASDLANIETGVTSSAHRPANSSDETELELRFARALSVSGVSRVVLVMDTLEEALLHRQTNLLALIETMERIHRHFGGVRLVLAGRYDLGERIPELARYGEDARRDFELARFLEHEATDYLRDLRGIDDTKLVTAIVERSDGNPFKLSLFADLWQDDRTLDDTRVRSYPDVSLQYLIERILERIPDPQLQWVLRYGVIPRVLTEEFVREVMAPRLGRGMGGDAGYDDSRAGIPERAADRREIFPTGLQPEEWKTLWDRLAMYASGYSWVRPAKDVAGALRFHPDVVEPMRELVAGQAVFGDINRAAIDHFERRAKDEPAAWAQWMREAVYHRMQLPKKGSGNYWRDAMREARRAHTPADRRLLAMDLLRAPYVNAEGKATLVRGSPIVSAETRLEANMELALASAELARESSGAASEQHWDEVRAALGDAKALEGTLGVIKTAKWGARLGVLAAQVAIHSGNARDALDLLTMEDPTADAAARLARAATRAEASAALGHPDAADQYAQVLEGAHTLPKDERERFLPRVRLAAARAFLAVDRCVATIEVCELHLGEKRGAFGEQELDFALLLSEAQQRVGNFAAAIATIERALDSRIESTARPRETARLNLRLARAHYERGAIAPALAAHQLAAGALLSPLSPDEPPEVQRKKLEGDADVLALRGTLLGALMDFHEALPAFDAATTPWLSAGHVEEASRCLARAMAIELRDIGDLRAAERRLARAQGNTLLPSSETWVLLRLLEAELRGRLDDPDGASAIVRTLLSEREALWPPRVLAQIAIVALNDASIGVAESSGLLVEALQRIDSVSGRLTALAPMSRCAVRADLPSDVAGALLDLVGRASAKRGRQLSDDVDDARLDLLEAELLRVVGRREAGASLVRRGWDRIAGDDDLLLLRREVIASFPRFGITPSPAEDESLQRFLRIFGQRPLLGAAMQIVDAESWLTAGDLDRTAALVAAAQDRPEREGRSTQWPPRLATLLARLAVARGEDGSLAAQSAISLYRSLGDEVRARALLPLMVPASPRPSVTGPALAPPAAPAPRRRGGRARPPLPDAAPPPPPPHASHESWWSSWWPSRAGRERADVSGAHGDYPVSHLPIEPSPPQMMGERGEVVFRMDTVQGAGAFTFSRTIRLGGAEVDAGGILKLEPVFGQPGARASVALPYEMLAMLADGWEHQGAQLAKAVLGDDIALIGDRAALLESALTLRIETPPGLMSALPWELLPASANRTLGTLAEFTGIHRGSRQDRTLLAVRHAQRALATLTSTRVIADGHLGPRTRAMLEEFQSRHGLDATGVLDTRTRAALDLEARLRDGRPPTVLVVQPSLERTRRRGASTKEGGADLGSVYASRGFNVDVLHEPNPAQLRERMARSPLDVIHLRGALRESPSLGGVLFDFGREGQGFHQYGDESPSDRPSPRMKDDDVFTPAVFDSMCESLADGASVPLLVFDIMRPSDDADALQQLFLRNAFGAEVLDGGNVRSIIATGVGRGWEEREMIETLVDSLRAGATPTEVAARMRARFAVRASHPLAEGLGALATAAFCHDAAVGRIVRADTPS